MGELIIEGFVCKLSLFFLCVAMFFVGAGATELFSRHAFEGSMALPALARWPPGVGTPRVRRHLVGPEPSLDIAPSSKRQLEEPAVIVALQRPPTRCVRAAGRNAIDTVGTAALRRLPWFIFWLASSQHKATWRQKKGVAALFTVNAAKNPRI